jgi:hypothetical protein
MRLDECKSACDDGGDGVCAVDLAGERVRWSRSGLGNIRDVVSVGVAKGVPQVVVRATKECVRVKVGVGSVRGSECGGGVTWVMEVPL